MTDAEIGQVSTLGLAHIGDGVYELLTRTALVESGVTSVQKLHRQTVARVRASAQARAAEKLAPALTQAEADIYKRGRNARVNSVPKNASLADYHAATGLEALFGWLWLSGGRERIHELFALITEDSNAD